ncbi:MAG: hypothetical protein HOV81_38220 [Kofleriaceae bacterium]|nr:hypothetical protein [Kofleriaceae bacterium]
MRRALAAVLALATTVVACHPTPVSTKAPPRPRLVVLIVIDQWPSWMFAKQKHLYTGGIGRLLREGALVPEAELPYANTFTAVGHATIGTGAPPNVNGIVGNYWYRRAENRDRPAEYDVDAPVLMVGAPLGDAQLSADDGSSAKALRVEGVADALRSATGGAGHSVAIALKARSACLIAGQHPDLAIWYEAGAGGMTTSKAYASTPPQWLVKLANDSPVSRYFGSTWTARDRDLLARETGIADDSPGEHAEHHLGTAFPHALATSDKPEQAIVQTPFADEIVARTVAFALDAMELGVDNTPDLLAISFSAHDYAGHSWGPDSWEVLDLTLRLDQALGQLFDALDARLGSDGWAVVMTSDHGATPLVERARIRSARRINPAEIEEAAQKAIEGVVGAPGPWVVKLVSSNLYLTPQFAALSDEQKNLAFDAATKAMSAVPGVALAGRTDRFSPGCTAEKDLYKAICLATVPGEAGDMYAVATAGSVISEYKGGTGHDAPFDDNRRVPIIVRAPGLAPQQGTGTLLQVAPTVSALLGISPPAAASEQPLFGLGRAPSQRK